MKKRLIVLLAGVALALPLGASVATAEPGGNSPDTSGDTGAACPENSPQGAGEDPSCGNADTAQDDRTNNGKAKGTDGQNGNDGANGQNGQNGQNGNGPDDGGDTGDACPPTSPNAGGQPPCGDDEGDDEAVNECTDGADNDADGEVDAEDLNDCQDGDTTEDMGDDDGATECNDGIDNDEDGAVDAADADDCQDGDTTEDTKAISDAECASLVAGPPPIVIELPLNPLAYACLIVFPAEGDVANCPDGAVPIALPVDPILNACLVVGPEAPATEPAF